MAKFDNTVAADPAPFERAMDRVAKASEQTMERLKKSTESVATPFEKLNGWFVGIAGIIAGGAFKHVIDETVAWGSEQAKLSRQLQVTTEAAAGYQVAAEDIGLSGETIITASDKMAKSLGGNEAAYKKLGIETRNASGAFRSTGELLPEVIDKLNGIHNVTEQNVAGQQIFGKGWTEVRGILRLSSEALAEATTKAKELHLVTDPDRIKQYKLALQDTKDITQSFEIQLGSKLLPVLTNFGKFMGEQAPDLANVFSRALQGVAFVAGSVWLTLKDMGDAIGALAAQAAALLSGDLEGMRAIGKMRDEQAAKNEAEFEKFKAGAFSTGAPVSKIAGPADSGSQGHIDFGDKGAVKSRMQMWEEVLATDKTGFELQQNAAGTFHAYSIQAESDYWRKILDRTDLSTAERLGASRKWLAAEQSIKRQTTAEEFARLKAEEEQYRFNLDAKLSIAVQERDRARELLGENDREYRDAAAHVVQIEREKQEQIKKLAEDAAAASAKSAEDDVAFREQLAQLDAQAGLTTYGEQLAQQRQFEAERYNIARKGLSDRLALLEAGNDADKVNAAKVRQELDALDAQHSRAQIINARQTQLGVFGAYTSMVSNIEGVWRTGISNLLQGTLTWHNAMRGIWTSISQAFTGMIGQMAAKWFAGEAIKTGATVLGVTERNAAEEAGALQSIAIYAASAIKKIAIWAYEAAAGAYTALVSIPYVGPFLAPAAAVAALAAVIGFGASISAAGGYDIPAGVNPIVQTHAREMILPARYADVIRGMANGEGGGGGGGDHYHINISALDGKSVQQLFMRHGPALVTALKAQQRSFNPGLS